MYVLPVARVFGCWRFLQPSCKELKIQEFGETGKRWRALQPDGNPESTLTLSAQAGITLTIHLVDKKWQAKAMLLTALDYGRGRQLKVTGYCLKDEIYYRAPYKA